MMRIKAKSESSLVDALEQFLRSTLPRGWVVRHADRASRPGGDRAFDAALTIDAPDGAQGLVVIIAKLRTEPANIPRSVEAFSKVREMARNERYDSVVPVVVSNYISERSRELLKTNGIGWYDLTGNTRIETDRPSLFIERTGAERNPYSDPGDRRLKSLRGSGAARVVRALLDGAEDTRARELADQAGVSAATSARVLRYLAQEHLVERDEHSVVQRIRKRSLAQAWAQDYGMTKTNAATAVLAPRGIDWLMRQLAERHLPFSLTGSAALRYYLPEGASAVTPLAMVAVYSKEVPRLQRELRLRPTDRGANVLLLEPFDYVVLWGARTGDGLQYTSPSQTVVDLLTSPGRGPEEAEQLMQVLAVEDEEWTL
jgi:DNA-binding HxlR family transcriptional regulator